jgi:3' terminal RNA ribose 2'-O-methyltransferase Hen1
MITIEARFQPAADLGYLLHKNPARAQEFDLGYGRAWVFYSEADNEQCRAHLALDIDPVRLVRKGNAASAYLDDAPSLDGSFMAVAIGKIFGTALTGRSKERPELAEKALPWTIEASAVRLRHADLPEKFFGPLGWSVSVEPFASGRAGRLKLEGEMRLSQALRHLTILLPALEGRRHFWVGADEVEKVTRQAGDWLATHPAQREILAGALAHRRPLITQALARLQAADGQPEESEPVDSPEPRLHDVRHEAVDEAVAACAPESVADLGCGGGQLLMRLLRQTSIPRLTGMEVSWRMVERLQERRDRMPPSARDRLQCIHGSLVYHDKRLAGHDCVTLVEVIEHLDPERLAEMARVVFGGIKPKAVIVTTPNREANVVLGSFEGMRHGDHRFEWTRAEFADWCARVGAEFGFAFEVSGIGPEHPEHGAPSQMAVFRR